MMAGFFSNYDIAVRNSERQGINIEDVIRRPGFVAVPVPSRLQLYGDFRAGHASDKGARLDRIFHDIAQSSYSALRKNSQQNVPKLDNEFSCRYQIAKPMIAPARILVE